MHYTVRHRCEEFVCPSCGRHVFVTENAWHAPGQGVYCQRYCAGQDPRQSAVHKRLESLIQHVRKAIDLNLTRKASGATRRSAGGS